jgi:hypothetical protein
MCVAAVRVCIPPQPLVAGNMLPLQALPILVSLVSLRGPPSRASRLFTACIELLNTKHQDVCHSCGVATRVLPAAWSSQAYLGHGQQALPSAACFRPLLLQWPPAAGVLPP